MRVLHLVRKRDDVYARAMIAEQSAQGYALSVVYLQDAVYGPFDPNVSARALDEDCKARGANPELDRIGYDELATLVFENDRVISW